MRRRLWIGGAALVAACAVGWWLGGVSRAPEPVAAAPGLVLVGDLQLELEPAWTPVASAAGLDVPGAQAFAPAAGLSARVVLAEGPLDHSSLVPPALRSALGAPLPEPRRADLGGLPAWTYGPVRGERRTLEVTVLPTTTGVLAVACSAPRQTWSVAVGCAAGVRSVSSVEGRVLEPGPALAFRMRSGRVLRRLDRLRVAARQALAGTRRPAPRAAAARRLARVHAGAAKALGPLADGGAPGAAVAALRGAANGYRKLGRAAARGWRPAYARARARVARADARLARALARLRA